VVGGATYYHWSAFSGAINGKLYVAAGIGNLNISDGGNVSRATWEFDPALGELGTWTRRADMPGSTKYGIMDGTSVVVEDRLLCFGGYMIAPSELGPYSGTSEYDPAADRWYERANLADVGWVEYVPTGAALGNRAYFGGVSLFEYTRIVTEPVIDLSVSGLTAPSSVPVGSIVTIAATVSNEGNRTATFTVDFSAGTESLGFASVVDLAGGESRVVSATWNTAGAAIATYDLRASIAPLIDEVDTGDNTAARSIQLTAVPMAVLAGKGAWAEHRRYSISGDEDAYQTLFGKVKNTGTVPVTLRVQFSLRKDGMAIAPIVTASKTLLFAGAGATLAANLNAAAAGVGMYDAVAQLQVNLGGTWVDSGTPRSLSFEIGQ